MRRQLGGLGSSTSLIKPQGSKPLIFEILKPRHLICVRPLGPGVSREAEEINRNVVHEPPVSGFERGAVCKIHDRSF